MSIHRQTKQKIGIAIGVTVFVTLLLLFAVSGDNRMLLRNIFSNDLSREELSDQLQAFGWRGYIVIAMLSALQVVCTFLPAEPVQMLGGFSFGFYTGLLCCFIGTLLGSTVIYLMQKLYGDRLRGFFVKKLNIDFEKIAHSNRISLIVLLLYLLPAIPYGLISFISASMGLSYRRFILLTTLGVLPSLCVGVGLGYMVTVSSGTALLCTLVVLLLVAAVVLYKRERMIAKLNDYADKHQKASKSKVRPANSLLLIVLYAGVRCYLFLFGVRIKAVNKAGKLNTPSIVLCNHGSFIDFIYAAGLLRKYKPHFIAARLYFYHSVLGWLLRTAGAFPKSMFAIDMENAKNCLTVLKNEEMLAMMPEARLSTTGRFEDIQGSTYSFVKKSGVDVYTIKINGDYLADPKWGNGLRRGALVEAQLDILYTAQQVQSMSVEELKQGIEQRLSYDEFQWLQQHPNIRYRSSRIAEGLENILTVCPVCGRKHSLITKKNTVACEHCGYLTSVDNRYQFDKDFCFADLRQWYDWQKQKLEQEIIQNSAYSLSSKVELRLPGDGKSLTRHGGEGVCTLDREGLVYIGTKEGESVRLHFSIQRVYRLLFGAGENFEIYDGTQILYFVPEEKRSAVDWYMASMILHDMAAK